MFDEEFSSISNQNNLNFIDDEDSNSSSREIEYENIDYEDRIKMVFIKIKCEFILLNCFSGFQKKIMKHLK